MNRLLDTNACIAYLSGRSASLKTKLEATDPAELLVCSIVRAELLFGAERSHDPEATRRNVEAFLAPFISLPFDDRAAQSHAVIRNDLTRRGELIGPNDLLIAAICLASDVTLVTHNVAEFRRVIGLKWEDWQQA